jgi:hypothetical protein
MNQQRLKELLNYDPVTGVFTRKVPFHGRTLAGSKEANGYWQIGIDGKTYKAHHLAWLYVYGAWPSQDIDHADTNKRNNAIDNLRFISVKQQNENRWWNSNNTSGYRGVHLCKMTNRWVAQIKHNYKIFWLGRFNTPQEAYTAYCLAAAKYHTHNPLGVK